MTNPDSIIKLIEAGVFTFLVTVFEGQAATDDRQFEVYLSGLRCSRRLLVNKSAADVFVAAGGAQAVIKLMAAFPESSITQMEVYKILLALISLYPPPPPLPEKPEEDEWGGKVSDEGVLGILHRMDRPPSPRSWESIGLTAADIRRLVASICQCLTTEGHFKQLKLQKCGLGLLAYFACEKIPGTFEGYQEGQFQVLAKQTLTTFNWDVNFIEMVRNARKKEKCLFVFDLFCFDPLLSIGNDNA